MTPPPLSFVIRTGTAVPPRRWFWVRVHADAGDLQNAARRLDPAAGRDFFAGCEGCCQPVTARLVDGRPVWPGSGYAGVVRLCAGRLEAGLVAHELMHAAVAVLRMSIGPDVRLGRSVGEREEQLGYVLGELVGCFDAVMRGRGLVPG